jgi:hypothetical protein
MRLAAPLVALVAPSLGRGGLERMVLDLALALPSRGFRVEVCCTSKLGARAEAARDLGVVVRDCSPGPLRIPGLPLKLAWSFPNPPDVLHAHGGAWRAAALAKTFLRAPRLVFTEHGLAGPRARWRTWFERWCAGRTDALAAVSPEASPVQRDAGVVDTGQIKKRARGDART